MQALGKTCGGFSEALGRLEGGLREVYAGHVCGGGYVLILACADMCGGMCALVCAGWCARKGKCGGYVR